jgi:hypothetical protein
MRTLRVLAASFLLLTALTVTASTQSSAPIQRDGTETPPLCVPGEPGCPK